MAESQEMLEVSLEKAIADYGPFTLIDREEADRLVKGGQGDLIFCIMEGDEPEEPEGAEDDPNYEPPDTEWIGLVGYHIVNIIERYRATKPMPFNLLVPDVWYTDGLPSP